MPCAPAWKGMDWRQQRSCVQTPGVANRPARRWKAGSQLVRKLLDSGVSNTVVAYAIFIFIQTRARTCHCRDFARRAVRVDEGGARDIERAQIRQPAFLKGCGERYESAIADGITKDGELGQAVAEKRWLDIVLGHILHILVRAVPAR